MLDMSQYKEEKLGSRPLRGLMVAGGGLDAEQVGLALEITIDGEGYYHLKGIQDCRTDPLGMKYVDGVISQDKARRVAELMESKLDARLEELGWNIQPC